MQEQLNVEDEGEEGGKQMIQTGNKYGKTVRPSEHRAIFLLPVFLVLTNFHHGYHLMKCFYLSLQVFCYFWQCLVFSGDVL